MTQDELERKIAGVAVDLYRGKVVRIETDRDHAHAVSRLANVAVQYVRPILARWGFKIVQGEDYVAPGIVDSLEERLRIPPETLPPGDQQDAA